MYPVEKNGAGDGAGEGSVYVTRTGGDVSGVTGERGRERTWYMVNLVWFETHGDSTTECCMLYGVSWTTTGV